MLALCLSSCWYAKQATRFLADRAEAIPLDRIAREPDTPASVAALIASVEEVRRFSVVGAGLSPTKNYTRYVETDKGYAADVVSACAVDSFERHYWTYPVLGAMPYKGFYDKADAEREAARLEASGLDVIVRQVDAFSSLGYFRDPLYSFMADYDEGEIAELILHESAHATLFVKGADQFNEEFATFVGRKGAQGYLEERYGPDSEALAARRFKYEDGEAFVAFLKGTASLLDAAYGDSSMSHEEKLSAKAAILSERAAVFRGEAEARFHDEGFRNFDMGAINNAYIDLYRLYEEDLGMYEEWFDRVAAGSLANFVSTVKVIAGKAGKDVKKAMAERLGLEGQAAAQSPY
jgi:predicted aminopeptidase